jgi:hypothetical protein
MDGQYNLSSSAYGFSLMYAEDFRKELAENILHCPTAEEKKDLIIFIHNEIERKLFKDEVFYDSEIVEYDMPEWANPQFQRSLIKKSPDGIYSLFARMCRIIEDVCKSYKIPVVETCSDRYMALSHFSMNPLLNKGETKILSSSEFIKEQQLPTEIDMTNTERLKKKLKIHKFYDLKMVKGLPDGAAEKLVELISTHDLPYQIAMLDYLGFINFFEKEYCVTKNILYKDLGVILGYHERTVQGNFNSLYKTTEDSKKRYTAHRYKETVKKDYQTLK